MYQTCDNCFIFRTIFYNEPISIREISRINKISPSKVSRIVKHLFNKRLISIEVIGRNYLIRPNLNNYLTKYLLLKEEASYTISSLQEYPQLSKYLNVKSDVTIIFGSYAEHTADDLSDIDILMINGNDKIGYNFTLSQFRKKLLKRNNTILSILKKHIILKGFELFIKEVIRWKKKLYGAQE